VLELLDVAEEVLSAWELFEELDEKRGPGESLGPFPSTATVDACKEWIETQGNDPERPLTPERIYALAPRVFEAAKARWATLDDHFPRDHRGPTVVQ